MEQLFLKIVGLSVSATGLILAVIILRPFLKRVPKWITCMLWVLVGLRLIIPFQVETSIGLMPKTETMIEILSSAINDSSQNPLYEAEYTALYGQNTISGTVTDTGLSQKTETGARANTDPSIGIAPADPFINTSDSGVAFFSGWSHAFSLIWLAGTVVMLLYLTVSYARLHNRLKTATLLRRKVKYTAGIKQSEYVNSPFILGLVKPYIYIPYHLEAETLTYVLAHEETHLRYRDHWLKMSAYLLLSVYWFHPLIWLAYVLFCQDLEFSCDERVINGLDENERRAYSRALLYCGGKRLYFSTCPIGFGETGVKERIMRVKKFRKPSLLISLLCVSLCTFIAVCFITNPSNSEDTQEPENEIIIDTDSQNENGSANTEAPAIETTMIGGVTLDEITYIEVTNGNNGQRMRFTDSDAGNEFTDLLNLYRQLDASGNAEPNNRVGYNYCMRLYDQNDTLLQTVTPYKDGFVVDSMFYACDMTVDHAPVNLMNYIDLLFYPGVSAVEKARENLLVEILDELEGLTYRDETCDGIPEINLSGNGTEYQINLSARWVWKDDREAELSEELVEKIQTMLIMK